MFQSAPARSALRGYAHPRSLLALRIRLERAVYRDPEDEGRRVAMVDGQVRGVFEFVNERRQEWERKARQERLEQTQQLIEKVVNALLSAPAAAAAIAAVMALVMTGSVGLLACQLGYDPAHDLMVWLACPFAGDM